jgi:hypothetical protein
MRLRRAANHEPEVSDSYSEAAETPNIFCFYFPQVPLSGSIERFWYWKGHTVSHSLERVLPTGTVELVLDLGNASTSNSVVSGPRSRSSIIQRTAQDELLGIHFKPGGAFPFFEFPLGDLRNVHVGMEDVWGREQADTLFSLLYQAESIEKRFRILEACLMKAIRRPLHHHPAAAFAIPELQRNPNLSMSQIAESVNLSQRRFI